MELSKIYKGLLSERQDIEKMNAANKIMKDISKKLKTNDYRALPKGFLNMNVIYLNFKELENLNIYLNDDPTKKTLGGAYYRNDGNPTIDIYNCKIDIANNKIQQLFYDKNRLFHELIHFLDDVQGHKLKGIGNIETFSTEYATNPSEYNAIFLEITREYDNEYYINKLPNTFNEFKNDIFSYNNPFTISAKQFYNKLDDVYKRKFITRLYLFYMNLKQKANKFQ